MAGLSFLPLGSVAGKAGLTSVTSGAGLSSVLGFSNPLTAGLSILNALGGLGGSVNISKGVTGGAASSGSADFFGENSVSLKKPLFDISKPVNVAIIAACVVGGIYIYKKHLR